MHPGQVVEPKGIRKLLQLPLQKTKITIHQQSTSMLDFTSDLVDVLDFKTSRLFLYHIFPPSLFGIKH